MSIPPLPESSLVSPSGEAGTIGIGILQFVLLQKGENVWLFSGQSYRRMDIRGTCLIERDPMADSVSQSSEQEASVGDVVSNHVFRRIKSAILLLKVKREVPMEDGHYWSDSFCKQTIDLDMSDRFQMVQKVFMRAPNRNST